MSVFHRLHYSTHNPQDRFYSITITILVLNPLSDDRQ